MDMTKEMRTIGPTEQRSIEMLKSDFSEYVDLYEITSWRWIVEPQAIANDDGTWRAYGRIEF